MFPLIVLRTGFALQQAVSTQNNQRLPMKLKYFITFLFLVGCASNSGIVPMGNDTYMVSRQASTGFSGMGTLKADAMREAYAQCQKTGKRVEILETIDAKPPYILGNFPKTEIRFQCVQ